MTEGAFLAWLATRDTTEWSAGGQPIVESANRTMSEILAMLAMISLPGRSRMPESILLLTSLAELPMDIPWEHLVYWYAPLNGDEGTMLVLYCPGSVRHPAHVLESVATVRALYEVARDAGSRHV